MSYALKAILRLFFGNDVDHENIPRLKIMLCILLSLACLMVIIGIMGNTTSFDNEPFNQAANAFLLDLNAGKITEAYARTSKDYQKEISEVQFKAIMQKNPYPTNGNGKGESSLLTTPRKGKTITYWFNDTRGSGWIRFTFEVTKQGDEYRVSKISLK